ncbi:MAG: hypothetical protein ABI795_01840 [Chthoniobacterales bacterium]
MNRPRLTFIGGQLMAGWHSQIDADTKRIPRMLHVIRPLYHHITSGLCSNELIDVGRLLDTAITNFHC